MGHISLPSPVTNIAIFKILATNLSKLLGIPSKRLEDIIYLRAYVVLDNGTTSLLKKGEILERRIDKPLISSILQEIIQAKELSKSVIKEAEELNKKISEEDNNKRVIETVFLEDYLDFLAKHWGIKIGTGTEAFQELLNRVNIEEELERVKNSLQEGPNKINQGKLRFLQALQKSGVKLE
jgi:DNA-directed RNA polymerase beta' subunit